MVVQTGPVNAQQQARATRAVARGNEIRDKLADFFST